MHIVHDSLHFVAVDKPAGWLSVPSRLGAADSRPCVGKSLEAQLQVRLWPVHRLDQEVTGLLLFAKDSEAHREAGRWFEQRLVHKTYEALSEVRGAVWQGGGDAKLDPEELKEGQELVWECLLERGKRRAFISQRGKPSLTRATFIQTQPLESQTAYAWRLMPVTGRAHQLRFELSRHGFPILGDQLYGASAAWHGANDGIALRCAALDFRDCGQRADFGLPLALRLSGAAAWQ